MAELSFTGKKVPGFCKCGAAGLAVPSVMTQKGKQRQPFLYLSKRETIGKGRSQANNPD